MLGDLAEATCRSCGTRQSVRVDGLAVAVVDVHAVRALLHGRPEALLCRACADALPVPAMFAVRGDGWSAVVPVDGSGGQPEVPDVVVRALGAHLHGVIGALWLARGRAAQQELARERYRELTAEAVAAALLAADGLLGDWVVGDGGDAVAMVDDMLGPPQATALVCAALSVVPDDGPDLAAVIGRHVAPGLVLPRAAEDLSAAITRMLDDGHLAARARICVLTVHAAACVAAGRADPFSGPFTREWITLAWAADERPDDMQLRRLQPPPDLLAPAVNVAELTAAVLGRPTRRRVGWSGCSGSQSRPGGRG
jgi:hypothetical protein